MHDKEPLFIPAEFFLVRAASFPIDEFFSFFAKNDPDALIDQCLNDPHFRQALAFSSKPLFNEIRKGKKSSDVLRSLCKYFSRITGRGTPYGLLSFVAWGMKDLNALSKLNAKLLKKRARPDMGWLHTYIRNIINSHSDFTDFEVQNNPVIEEKNGRYVTTYFLDKTEKKSSSIKKTALTELVFSECRSAITVKKLAEVISTHFPNASKEQIIGTVKTLIDEQFLWYALYAQTSSFWPLRELKKNIPIEYKKQIEELEEKIELYNSIPLNESEDFLCQISDEMAEKGTSPRLALQVDLGICEKQIGLPQEVLEQVAKGGEILWKINTLKAPLFPLKSYHLEFLKKYGERRLVPLNELLDPLIGLGSPDYEKKGNEREESNLSTYYQWLGRALSKALKNKDREIVLDKKTISELVPNPDYTRANSSIDVFFEIYADSIDRLNSGQYQIFITNFVNSGGATFGRFMDLLSPELAERMESFYKEEAKLDQDVLSVETFYIPQNSNVQNVAISPSFRSSKIDLSSPDRSTIRLDEIYVGATKEFIYLTDAQGSKDLRFISTNVLVDIYAPEPLRFIREVSQQRNGRMQLWPWGSYGSHTHLPRIRYENLILSPERWMISLSCIQASKEQAIEEISEKLADWIAIWELPQYVFITEGDNRLLIDCSCKEHVRIAAGYLKKDEKIFLIEKIGQEKGEWIESDQGRHSVEFVLPLRRNPIYRNEHRKIPRISYRQISSLDRFKVPGSDWFYYQFCLSSDIHNEFLLSQLSPFAEELAGKKLIEDWFFIRYRENEQDQIRFRMRVSSESLIGSVFFRMKEFTQNLFEMGLIRDLSLCSYEREIERYGGTQLIELCEELFCADSYLVLKLLQFESKELPIHIIGALSVLDLLEHLLSDPSIIREFFSRLDLDKSGLSGYREWRKILEGGFKSVFDSIGEGRARILQAISAKLNELGSASSVNIYSLAASLVHMHCNRLSGTDPNLENKIKVYVSHFIKNSFQLRENGTKN